MGETGVKEVRLMKVKDKAAANATNLVRARMCAQQNMFVCENSKSREN